MIRTQNRKNTLLWLIKPEDSSSWENKGKGISFRKLYKKTLAYSISKFIFWYSVAIAVTILLAKLQ